MVNEGVFAAKRLAASIGIIMVAKTLLFWTLLAGTVSAIEPASGLAQAAARTWRVCAGPAGGAQCRFASLEEALKVAQPGDTIVLAPGTYREGVLITTPRITIKGEPGAHLQGVAYNGKAALVVRADHVTIDGIECSGIAVRDHNGACVRIEGRDLVIRNAYFHDNQEGVLGGHGGSVRIENSRFARNGNALFGQRTWNDTVPGLVPLLRDEDADHRVRAFPDLLSAVRTYMHNLNTHPAYDAFRRARAAARARGAAPDPLRLAETLTHYAELGEGYIDAVCALIRVNRLREFDGARLAYPDGAKLADLD